MLPALERLIMTVSASTQIWVVSHSSRLIVTLNQSHASQAIELEKT